jgi:surface antigen
MLNSTRDFETEEQVSRCDALKEALMSNLAAACLAQGEAAQAIDWCDKALEMNPDSAKVGQGGKVGGGGEGR